MLSHHASIIRAQPALRALPDVHEPLVNGDVAALPDRVETENEEHRRDGPRRRSDRDGGNVADVEALEREGNEERDNPRTCVSVSITGTVWIGNHVRPHKQRIR